MDGWRKPKRKAEEPPAAPAAPLPLDARGPSDRRGGASPAGRADALPADARLADARFAVANGDLAPILARLREDLESAKRASGVCREGRGARASGRAGGRGSGRLGRAVSRGGRRFVGEGDDRAGERVVGERRTRRVAGAARRVPRADVGAIASARRRARRASHGFGRASAGGFRARLRGGRACDGARAAAPRGKAQADEADARG